MSLLKQVPFYFKVFFIKKSIWFSCVVLTHIFLPYSDWHSDMYPFYKTQHVNHSIYFLNYYFLNGSFKTEAVPLVAIKYRTQLYTFWKMAILKVKSYSLVCFSYMLSAITRRNSNKCLFIMSLVIWLFTIIFILYIPSL